ncbi:hypothetical protein Ddye_031172 [Dipteronia dyeriana]|uniref:Uncharacterized protein n=1 Tax=Dipteronia dyeriana TaxID=168575 RepID=A0AAD9THT8_9ROSI|nr:hypothetical protein Ddye_031172 [Dipteronia dyeriana]
MPRMQLSVLVLCVDKLLARDRCSMLVLHDDIGSCKVKVQVSDDHFLKVLCMGYNEKSGQVKDKDKLASKGEEGQKINKKSMSGKRSLCEEVKCSYSKHSKERVADVMCCRRSEKDGSVGNRDNFEMAGCCKDNIESVIRRRQSMGDRSNHHVGKLGKATGLLVPRKVLLIRLVGANKDVKHSCGGSIVKEKGEVSVGCVGKCCEANIKGKATNKGVKAGW